MDLVVLGSGACYPQSRRAAPGYLVREGDATIALDLSAGTLDRLAPLVPLAELGLIVLSHLHLDHCGDLATLLFGLNAPYARRTQPAVVHGPPGLRDRLEQLRGVYGDWLDDPPCGLELHEWADAEVRWRGWRLRAVAVQHPAAGHAWRLVSPSGRVLVYSGDSGPCAALQELAAGADLLLVDCAQPEGSPFRAHLTPGEVAELARDSAPARVVLTHFTPDTDAAEALRLVRAACDVPVAAAEDGLCLPV